MRDAVHRRGQALHGRTARSGKGGAGGQQLRAVFELATQCLVACGNLVLNAFAAQPGYAPDDAARELGQHCYTTIFTPQELSAAASGLPVQLVSDDSVDEYELSHLPEGAWPPTCWYADWVSGRASSISRVRNAHRDALARCHKPTWWAFSGQ